MTVQVLRYSRANAEIRGMVSRLLSWEQLRAMAAADSLTTAIGLLGQTPYSSLSYEQLQGQPDLSVIERSILVNLADAYLKVSLLLPGGSRLLVEEMARRLEVDNLKAILRALNQHEPLESIQSFLIPLGRLTQLPIQDLFHTESIEGALDFLDRTPYGRPLRFAFPRYLQEGTLFPLEVALDQDYYRRLWSIVAGLHGRDGREAGYLIGSRYDVLNIIWIARFRLIYEIPPIETFNYTLSHGYRLNNQNIRQLIEANGLAEFMAAIPRPYQTAVAGIERSENPIEQIELALQRLITHLAEQALLGYPFQVGVATAYLWLKEAEVNDLRAILEGKAKDWQEDRIVGFLWRHG